MLKGLLRRLTGQHVKKDSSPAVEPPVATVATEPAMVTFVDEFGRELQVTEAVWREQILAPNLEKNASNPEALSGLIVSAMNDGLFADVEQASARLVVIDPMPERAYALRGIVLMKLGRLDEAEVALREGMARAGETGTLLTNLAKVWSQRGDEVRVDEILERAVMADPNQENGLGWWIARIRDRDSDAAVAQALARAAAVAGAWRPQLWQADACIAAHRLEDALAIYRDLLARADVESDVLVSISGNLGNAGRLDLLLSLVPGRFVPGQHDFRVGLNLLEAYRQAEQIEPGKALLHRMYELQQPVIKQYLDRFAASFDELAARQPPVAPDVAVPKIELVPLDRPIWEYGIDHPRWLFVQKPETAPRIVFYVPTVENVTGEQPGLRCEDTTGRLSRAIPLYLAEAVHEWTQSAAETLFPVVPGGGPAVIGGTHDVDELIDAFAARGDWLVTGSIAQQEDDSVTIDLGLWRMANREQVATTRERMKPEDPASFGLAIRMLERWLLSRIDQVQPLPADRWYGRVPEEWLAQYLLGLNQSLMLTLVSGDIVRRGELYGERDMLERPMILAAQFPDAGQLRIMALSALAKARRSGSDAYGEFRNRVYALMRSGLPPETLAALKPLAHFAAGDDQALQAACVGTLACDDDAYRAWLRALLVSATGQDPDVLH